MWAGSESDGTDTLIDHKGRTQLCGSTCTNKDVADKGCICQVPWNDPRYQRMPQSVCILTLSWEGLSALVMDICNPYMSCSRGQAEATMDSSPSAQANGVLAMPGLWTDWVWLCGAERKNNRECQDILAQCGPRMGVGGMLIIP